MNLSINYPIQKKLFHDRRKWQYSRIVHLKIFRSHLTMYQRRHRVTFRAWYSSGWKRFTIHISANTFYISHSFEGSVFFSMSETSSVPLLSLINPPITVNHFVIVPEQKKKQKKEIHTVAPSSIGYFLIDSLYMIYHGLSSNYDTQL